MGLQKILMEDAILLFINILSLQHVMIKEDVGERLFFQWYSWSLIIIKANCFIA